MRTREVAALVHGEPEVGDAPPRCIPELPSGAVASLLAPRSACGRDHGLSGDETSLAARSLCASRATFKTKKSRVLPACVSLSVTTGRDPWLRGVVIGGVRECARRQAFKGRTNIEMSAQLLKCDRAGACKVTPEHQAEFGKVRDLLRIPRMPSQSWLGSWNKA